MLHYVECQRLRAGHGNSLLGGVSTMDRPLSPTVRTSWGIRGHQDRPTIPFSNAILFVVVAHLARATPAAVTARAPAESGRPSPSVRSSTRNCPPRAPAGSSAGRARGHGRAPD